jgi:hypothetical protein
MIMPGTGYYKPMVPIYETMWQLIQEDGHLHRSTTSSVKKIRNLRALQMVMCGK